MESLGELSIYLYTFSIWLCVRLSNYQILLEDSII